MNFSFQKPLVMILLGFVVSVSTLFPFSQAKAAVPTFDVSLNPKEYGLDAIAYGIARTLLRTLTTSLINWLRTGGSSTLTGGPLFVQDFTEHFRRELDNAAGLFLEAYLDPAIFNQLCSPFRIPLGNLLNTAVLRRTSFIERARCTPSQILNNIENFDRFIVSYSYGGWEEWERLLSPSGNWIGSYFLGVEEAERLQREAAFRSRYEILTTGGGFLPAKNCQRIGGSIGSFVVNCVIDKPGIYVAQAAKATFQIDIDRLISADEINEIIAAAIDALVSWALTGGGPFADVDTGGFQPTPQDTVSPTAFITSPLNNSTVSSTVAFSASAFDNVGITNVTFFANGFVIGADGTLPYSIQWNTALFANGTTTITAQASDAAGNIGSSAPITVFINN